MPFEIEILNSEEHFQSQILFCSICNAFKKPGLHRLELELLCFKIKPEKSLWSDADGQTSWSA